ncbi:hypothetical protein DSO57_1034968, partial [Entomophthora muscae]
DKHTSKQPKGTKRPSRPTKSTKKKPVSSKKATPKPSPEPSPEKIPAHSTGGEETNGSLTDHSFYNSASDEEPTKKQCQAKKTPPKDKSPAHEEHQDKPSSASPPLGLCQPRKETITANAVIAPFALPRNLLLDSPMLGESKISLKKEGLKRPSVFRTARKKIIFLK